MTLKRLTEAAYALLVESWTQMEHHNWVTAIDKVRESLELQPEARAAEVSAVDNDRALAELNRMLAGVVKA